MTKPELQVAFDRHESAEARRMEAAALLREKALAIEEGELDMNDVAIILMNTEDPDRVDTQSAYTMRPSEAFIAIDIFLLSLRRDMGVL